MTPATSTPLWFDPAGPATDSLEPDRAAEVEPPREEAVAAAGVDRTMLVQGEQVRTAYGETRRPLPSTVVPNLVAAAMLVAAMWGEIDSAILVGWYCAQLAYQAARTLIYRAYWRNPPSAEAAPKWIRLWTLQAMTNGCIWGAAGLLFFSPNPIHEAMLTILLCGVAAGTIAVNAVILPSFMVAVLAIMPALTLRMFLTGDTPHIVLGAMLTLYMTMIMVWGREMHRVLIESFMRRFSNLELIGRLSRQTEIAEIAKMKAEAADTAKSKFLAAASHDLRQPMHALSIFSEILREEQDPQKMREVAGYIDASVKALGHLFDALLDISRLDAGVVPVQEADFPLDDLLARLHADFRPLAARKGLRMDYVPTRAVVRADPILLEQMLRNLLANAVRYTDRGAIVFGCRWRTGRVRIEVRDTGVGIPVEHLEAIFHEFVQINNPERDREKGLGLGLAIVRRLSILLDYPVEVKSRLSRGSVFSIELPVGRLERAAGAGGEGEPAGLGGLTGFGGLRVLVIDDEAGVLHATGRLLAGWGCEPLLAESLGEAAAQLKRGVWSPQFVLCDYRLREGASGVDALDWLRIVHGERLPCILITGDIEAERLRAVRESGYTVLHKPVQPAKLRAVMRGMLGN
jgi:signal transduction histidine kinase